MPDRAPDTRKIMDLLMKLEPQARRAGGYVHALIGNHEAMNMEGDLRYTTPAEFAAFVTPGSAAIRDRYYAAVVAALKAHPPAGPPLKFDAAFRAQFDAEHPLGWVEHQIAWSPQGPYGRWVLTHPAIIRIDDALYLHGGLGPEFVPFDYDVMNKAVITALNHQSGKVGGPHDILWNEQGPLWYRGLAQHDEAAEAPNVDAILARYKVSHIVIGHTKQYTQVNARFDGKVLLTDVFSPNRCVDPHAFLIKQGDTLTTVYRGQRSHWERPAPPRRPIWRRSPRSTGRNRPLARRTEARRRLEPPPSSRRDKAPIHFPQRGQIRRRSALHLPPLRL